MTAQKISRILAWAFILGGCALVISLVWPTILRDVGGLTVAAWRTPGLAPTLLLISMVMAATIVFLGPDRIGGTCRERPWTATALAMIGATHAFIIAGSVHLFLLPPGSSVRPMGWAVACMCMSVGCIFGVGVISMVGIFGKERGTVFWVLMMVGALTTFVAGPILLMIASRVVGFEISD